MSSTNRTKQDGTVCPVAARPFLKWVGGKTQLLPELIGHVPAKFGTYFEPFVGGGALFFELQSRGLIKHGAVLSDANEELINTYVQVRDNVSDVIRALRAHSINHSEAHYYATRAGVAAEPGRLMTSGEKAARFIYINKAGFNGLWRVNRKGECNVPWGKHEKFEPDEENLWACSEALQGVEMRCCDFSKALQSACSGDFVYCDPPYFPTSPTANFTSYTNGGFGMSEQVALASKLDDWDDADIHVVASNANTPECRKVYAEHAPTLVLHEVQARRAVNCVGAKRGKVGELIIVGETL